MATQAIDTPTGAGAIGEVPAGPTRRTGLNAAETHYMRGDKEPVAGSIPMSTSRFLNSPLFVHAFTRMALRRHGDDVTTTYDIPDMSRGLADVADYEGAVAGLDAEKVRNPAFRDFLERRPQLDFSISELEKCASGTLGAAIAAFVRNTGYDLQFVHKGFEAVHDLDYLVKRNGQCHDIMHIATGFGPNSAGENALALMNVASNAAHLDSRLAQFLSMPNIFVTASSWARIGFNYPEGTSIQLEAMQRGIAAGRAIKMPLLLVEWDKYLDWQLADIATDLGFERGPDEDWAFSETLSRG